MQVFTTVLLIIVLILLILDVVFLYRIQKSPITRNRNTFDKRFFELKFEIRLIEVVATILLFVGTFLGASSLNEIKMEFKSDLEFEIKALREETVDFETKLIKYTKSLDSLKSEEGKSIENLNDVRREFGIINKKVTQTQEALRYTSRMYIVNGIKNNHSKFESFKLYFKNLTTMDNEKLPNFNSTPVVSVQSTNSLYAVEKITKEYVQLKPFMGYMDEKEALLNLWIFYRHQ